MADRRPVGLNGVEHVQRPAAHLDGNVFQRFDALEFFPDFLRWNDDRRTGVAPVSIFLIFYPDETSLILYIFDRFNASGLDAGQVPRIYDPRPNLKKRSYNIEHFLAQKFKEGKKDRADRGLIDNIGNLLPIYFKDNGRLGSKTPSEKIEMLKGELDNVVLCLPFIKDFISKYSADAANWDKEKVLKRAKDLALRAYREAWRFK